MRIDFWTLFLFMKSLKITTLLIHPFLWSVIYLVCIEINLKYFSYQKMEKWHKLMSFIMCHIDSIEPDFHFNKFIYVSWGHSIIIDMVAHSTTQAIWLHISHSNSSIFTYSRNTPSTTHTISRTSTNFDCTVKIANWHAGASYVDVERKRTVLCTMWRYKESKVLPWHSILQSELATMKATHHRTLLHWITEFDILWVHDRHQNPYELKMRLIQTCWKSMIESKISK